jgi:tetratricopeptide (TPR) repeat protein
MGLVLIALGAVALGLAYQPEHAFVMTASQVAERGVIIALKLAGQTEDVRQTAAAALNGAIVRFGGVPIGLILLVGAILPGRNRSIPSQGDDGEQADLGATGSTIAAEPKSSVARRARKQAAALARKGNRIDAAELCLDSGLMDEAAGHFIKANQWVRAAEVRHDQNRFAESAELYLQAELPELAARIYSQQDMHLEAAEAYEGAGNQSVAAELFEQAGEHVRAAENYEQSGFPRNAAQAYIKAGMWEKGAICMELTISEEMSSSVGGVQSPQVKKFVRMAGNLFVRAGLEERAEAVLARGESFAEAAAIALKNGRKQQAVAYFLEAKDAPRAADVMRELGQADEAARVLAEHHRDLGDDEQAAVHYEEAGELLSAGDLYRMLEMYDRAASCYERFGDAAQAAEMFGLAGEGAQAAASYEKAGLYAEAAEHAALEGDEIKQAELLDRAGHYLRAGKMHRVAGRDDEAISGLQQVSHGHPDFAESSAILGEIFRSRGENTLAIKKLGHATEGAEITKDNVRVFYGLAAALEANGQTREAHELYERVLAFDYSFSDTQACLERTAAKLDAESEQSANASGTANTPTAQAGRYKIVGKLGRGGMGVVYKAVDTLLDRTVAYKVLPDSLKENPQALKNFLREAKSAAKLNHPGIVTVYDAGEQDGEFYIAMEHVDGNTLKDIVKRRGKISPSGIVHVLSQMCEALAYAHDKRVIHRDIKTANVMWTRDKKAKLMDFGLAKVIEEVRNHTTVVSGTRYSRSPEHALGRNVDHRTDIYSLGVTIFELATGTLPFREGNLPYHHVHTAPPDPREFNAQLPPVLAGIIARCLQKAPDDRYDSCLEIASELKGMLRESGQQTKSS